jgi:hypothetical protein
MQLKISGIAKSLADDEIVRNIYKSLFSEEFVIRMSTLRYTIVTLKYDVCKSSHFSCSSNI